MEIQNVTGPDVMRTSFTATPQSEKADQTKNETQSEPLQKVEDEQKGFSVDTYA